jgi:plasmid maintenance system killer protein
LGKAFWFRRRYELTIVDLQKHFSLHMTKTQFCLIFVWAFDLYRIDAY